jgi:hypothetical protein
MNMQSTTSVLRELEPHEIALVAGGGTHTYYYEPDGTRITENWDDNGNFLSLNVDFSNSSSGFSMDNVFACIGGSEILAAGLCYGADDLYMYAGFGVGAGPVDVTIGYSDNVDAYLSGLSSSSVGAPGFGVSFNNDGSIASTAWVVGTPGIQDTYGTSFSDIGIAAQNTFEVMSEGFYDMLGRPYDGAGGGGGGDGGGFHDNDPIGG